MDKKLNIAHILVVIALIGQFYYSPTFVHKIIVLISIILFLFSIDGSHKALLALIGLFLFYSFNSLFVINYDLDVILRNVSSFTFSILIIITISATLLLFKSIDINEISFQFSVRTPVKLTIALYLILVFWVLTSFYFNTILNYNEFNTYQQYDSLTLEHPVFAVFFLILSIFIVFSLLKKSTVGFVLAPIVMIAVTIIRIDGLLSKLYMGEFYKLSNLLGFISYCAFPILATELAIIFISSLRENNKSILVLKKRDMIKLALLTLAVLSSIALLFNSCNENSDVPVSLKWKCKIGFHGGIFFMDSTPVVVDDVVYVGNRYDYIYALDKETGQPVWKFYKKDVGFTSPSVIEDVIYVGGWSYVQDKKCLYAIDASSGKMKWSIELGNSQGLFGMLTVVNGVIYIGSSDKHLYAVGAESGDLKWSYNTGNHIATTPSVAYGVVYITSGHYLYAIDTEKGELKWQCEVEASIISSPTVFNGLIYVVSFDSTIYAIGAENGDQKWRYMTEGGIDSTPFVVDDVLYVGSLDHYLYSLDAKTGELKWRFETGYWVSSSPSVVEGVVYVGSRDNYLYAIDSNSGLLKWRYKLEGESEFKHVSSSIVVDDNVIYFGSEDGYIYALEIEKQ